MINRIVFWEPSVSPHKADLFSAIACLLPNVEIINVADRDIHPDRRALGWVAPPVCGYEQIIAPTTDQCSALGSLMPSSTLHIFSGIRHIPSIVCGLKAVRKSGAYFGLMSEPRVAHGFLGKLRFVQSWITESWLRKNVSFVLAIGRNGPDWFHSVGYKKTIVFPYGYFVNYSKEKISYHPRSDNTVRVGYLGRLVRMKGVHNLISAVAMMPANSVELVIAGSGEYEGELKEQANELGIKVRFEGVIPMLKVADFLSHLDVLVLPSISNDDGWGVVVSEALLSGVPVIASKCVGASIVLSDVARGVVIRPNSPYDIVEGLNMVIQENNLSNRARDARRIWAVEHLTGSSGGKYFVSLLDHVFGGAPKPTNFFD